MTYEQTKEILVSNFGYYALFGKECLVFGKEICGSLPGVPLIVRLPPITSGGNPTFNDPIEGNCSLHWELLSNHS